MAGLPGSFAELALIWPPQAYLWFKALHIVGVVVWFAGLFYLVRLFIYHQEAEELEEPLRQAFQAQYGLIPHVREVTGFILAASDRSFLAPR